MGWLLGCGMLDAGCCGRGTADMERRSHAAGRRAPVRSEKAFLLCSSHPRSVPGSFHFGILSLCMHFPGNFLGKVWLQLLPRLLAQHQSGLKKNALGSRSQHMRHRQAAQATANISNAFNTPNLAPHRSSQSCRAPEISTRRSVSLAVFRAKVPVAGRFLLASLHLPTLRLTPSSP